MSALMQSSYNNAKVCVPGLDRNVWFNFLFPRVFLSPGPLCGWLVHNACLMGGCGNSVELALRNRCSHWHAAGPFHSTHDTLQKRRLGAFTLCPSKRSVNKNTPVFLYKVWFYQWEQPISLLTYSKRMCEN